jgi:hypothetical protein
MLTLPLATLIYAIAFSTMQVQAYDMDRRSETAPVYGAALTWLRCRMGRVIIVRLCGREEGE